LQRQTHDRDDRPDREQRGESAELLRRQRARGYDRDHSGESVDGHAGKADDSPGTHDGAGGVEGNDGRCVTP